MHVTKLVVGCGHFEPSVVVVIVVVIVVVVVVIDVVVFVIVVLRLQALLRGPVS